MNELEKSISDFNMAIGLDSKNAIIYSNRGLVNRKLEKYSDAINDYTLEIEHSPLTDEGTVQNIKAYNNRAYCLAKIQEYKHAIQDYSKVIS